MKTNLKTVLFLAGLLSIVSVPCVSAHTDVTAEEAKELIDTTDDLTVVDVREPYEYNSTIGHIPGALNYPWNSGVLKADYEELPADGPILVVCGSGSRSNRAANFLDSKDFSMVYDMLGGMSAWKWETETDVDPDSKYGGGTGEPDDPYQIATADDLMLLGETTEDYDKHFILTADIDLDPNLPGRKIFDRAVIAPDMNDTDDNFQGIRFTGVFDGDEHTISHLKISGESFLGLFGRLDSEAIISNLGLESVDVKGTGYEIGGLVGSNGIGFGEGGLITNCYSIGTVNGESYIGGLVGFNAGSITASYSIGAINGGDHVGGLVGLNGWNEEGGYREGFITNCYSNATVSGGYHIGGLAGKNCCYITASYSMGVVNGVSYIGGLVGYSDHIIETSYSTCTVSGEHYVGGLVGDGWNRIVTNCFWDMETSDQDTSFGGTGKTTAEMQTASTFLEAGWDFVGETENGTEDIWSICEGTNYPRFVWHIPVGDFVCPDGITMDDFLFLLEFWLNDNCDSSNDFCQGTDLDQSGTVDEDDLEIFFELWLTEK